MLEWIEGDHGKALTLARTRGAPLLLWWTAEWCPPCHELKRKLLEHREFAEATSAIVRLRIESDMPGAQRLADALGLQGYPTFIAYDSAGRELIRLPPSGISRSLYVSVLQASLQQRIPLAERAARLAQREELAYDDAFVLSHHYWPQDPSVFGFPSRGALLERLWNRVHASHPSLRRQVFGCMLREAVRSQSSADAADLAAEFRAILASRSASYAELYELNVACLEVLDYLETHARADRQQLARSWSAAIEPTLTEPHLTRTEQLIGLYAVVRLTRQLGPLPPALLARARTAALAAETELADPSDRQTALNMAGYVLWELALRAETELLYERAIRSSAAPHYFMQPYARFLVERGERTQALQWLERAWSEAPGPATRFTIGSKYLALLDKDGAAQIAHAEDVASRLLAELASSGEGVHGRLTPAFTALIDELSKWLGGLEEPQRPASRLVAAMRALAESDPEGSAHVERAARRLVSARAGN